MAALVRYLSHPQVLVDPAVPVPEWGLSAVGRARASMLRAAPWLGGTVAIVSSAEAKAVETAQIVGAAAAGVAVQVRPDFHENDRSATGYLPGPEFEATADRFFAEPRRSVRGWETAAAAQERIVRAVDDALADLPPGDVLIVGHGAVGTLLLCHRAGWPIDRRHDQPAGGGNVLLFDRAAGTVRHGWRPLEQELA